MNDRPDALGRYSTLGVVACLFEDIRYLKAGARTRLRGYSVQFLLDIRRELDGFSEDLRGLINQRMTEVTGDQGV